MVSKYNYLSRFFSQIATLLERQDSSQKKEHMLHNRIPQVKLIYSHYNNVLFTYSKIASFFSD